MGDFQHVLAIPLHFYGHIYPLLNLCGKLSSRVCCSKVSMLVHEENVRIAEDLKHNMEINGEIDEGVLSIHSFALKLPPQFTGGVEGVRELASHLSNEMRVFVLEAALKIASLSKISCVLSDHQLGWSQDIANQLKVPRISLWIGGFPEFALISHMPNLVEEDIYNPNHDDAKNSKMIHVPGYSPIPPWDVPQISQIPEARGLYWEYCLAQMRRVKEAKYVLINSFYELDKEACDYLVKTMELPLKLVGPLLPKNSPCADPEGCLSWLDKQPHKSVLYASFGTLVKMTSQQLEEIFFGFEESGERFLIAFRTNILEEEPGPELAAFLDRYKMADDLLGRKIVQWSPQHKVLKHPAVGGFFTHFGTNSLYEAIESGVPMIGKPLLGDAIIQRRIAIDHWKIALEMSEDRRGVSKAVTQLIHHSDELRRNVLNLQKHLHKTMEKDGDTHKVLDELVLF